MASLAEGLAKRLWGHAQQAAHVTSHMALMCEAGFKRDLANWQLAFDKKILRPFDSTPDQVLMRRQAYGCVKQCLEVRNTYPGCSSNVAERDVPI